MEHMEVQRNKGPRASVPQFGGWDQKKGASEASLGYTMVFTKARADRQHQKNDLSYVKRQTHQQLQGHHLHHQDNLPSNNNKPKGHQQSPHQKKHDRRHGKPEEEEASDSGSATSNSMGKKRNKILRFFTCFRP